MHTAVAQNIDFNSDFLQNTFVFNPARAGNFYHFSGYTPKGSEAFVGFSTYWVNSEHAITLGSASFHSNIRRTLKKQDKEVSKFGIGGTLFNDKVHVFQRTGVSVSYSYNLDFDKSRLSFGLSTSYLNQSINVGNATIRDTDDPELLNNAWSGNFFNVGSGITYRFESEKHNELIIDFSANNLLNSVYNKRDGSSNFLYKNTGGIAPAVFYNLSYAKTFIKPTIDDEHANRVREDVAQKKNKEDEKLFEVLTEEDLEYRDSLINSGMEAREALELLKKKKLFKNESQDRFSDEKEKMKEAFTSFTYTLNPYVSGYYEHNQPMVLQFGIANAIGLSKARFKLLYGIGFQFQNYPGGKEVSGINFSINSFAGFKFNERLTTTVSMDNGINTFMRHNDVYRLGIGMKYNIYKD